MNTESKSTKQLPFLQSQQPMSYGMSPQGQGSQRVLQKKNFRSFAIPKSQQSGKEASSIQQTANIQRGKQSQSNLRSTMVPQMSQSSSSVQKQLKFQRNKLKAMRDHSEKEKTQQKDFHSISHSLQSKTQKYMNGSKSILQQTANQTGPFSRTNMESNAASVKISQGNFLQKYPIQEFYLTDIEKKIKKTRNQFESIKNTTMMSIMTKQSVVGQEVNSSAVNVGTEQDQGNNVYIQDSNKLNIEGDQFIEQQDKQIDVLTANQRTVNPKTGVGITDKEIKSLKDEINKSSFMEHLPISVRMVISENGKMKQVLEQIKQNFFCLEEISSRVKCYRVDLGCLMENSLEQLKQSVDQVLINTVKIIKHNEKTQDQIYKQKMKSQEKMFQERNYFEQQVHRLKQMVEIKNLEKNYFECTNQSLQQQFEFMKDSYQNIMLKQGIRTTCLSGLDKPAIEEPKKGDQQDAAAQADQENSDTNGPKKVKSESLKEIDYEDLEERQRIRGGDMQAIHGNMMQIIHKFSSMIKTWENDHDGQKENLNQMKNTIRVMMAGGREDKACQVSELEVFWGVDNLLKADVIDNQTFSANLDLKVSSVCGDANIEMLDQIQPEDNLQKLIIEEKKEAAEEISDCNDDEESHDEVIEKGTMEVIDDKNAQTDQSQDKQRRGSSLRNSIIAKKGKQQKNKGQGATTVATKAGSQQMKPEHWKLPISMVIFLNTAFNYKQTVKVVPWFSLRNQIQDIYKLRMKEHIEIDCNVSNSYVNLEEYTCLYFLKLHSLRRIAEVKMLEFVASIKYYSKVWPRANLFAKLCNFLTSQTGISSFKQKNLNDYDIYTQHYFFYAQELIFSKQSSLIEESDATYISSLEIPIINKRLFFFLNTSQMDKFARKVNEKLIHRKKIEDQEAIQVNTIDIDKYLVLIIEEFIEARKRNLKSLKTAFARGHENEKGYFSCEEFKKMIVQSVDLNQKVGHWIFPKDLIINRAFLYSLTCHKNQLEINSKEFLLAMHRFGLDSPFPSVLNKDSSVLRLQEKFDKQQESMKDPLAQMLHTAKELQKAKSRDEKQDNQSVRSQKQIDGPLAPAGGRGIPDEDTVQRGIVIDSATTLFAQHYSILRELRGYCIKFKEELAQRNDPEIIWRNLDLLMSVLDAGCHFLKFPVN